MGEEKEESFSLETTIGLDGRACPERLIVDPQQLSVVNGHRQEGRQWRFDQIGGFRVEPSIGSCFLQARVDQRWVDVLRRPGSVDPRLRELADRLAMRCGRERSAEQDGQAAAMLGRPPRTASADGSPGPAPSQRPRATAQILSLLRPFRGSVMLLLALSLGAVAIDVVPPILQKLLVDRVLQISLPKSSPGRLLYLLLAIIAGLLLVRLAATLVTVWKGIVASRVGTTLTANLRNDLVRKLNELPLAFHDRNQVGILMSQVAYDTESLHTLVYHMTSGFLLQSFQLAGIGVMLFYLNAKLALITLLPMPLILAGSWYFTRYLQPRHHHYWEAVGKQASALVGMLGGIRVVKAFVQEDREVRRFCESSRRLRDSRMTVDASTSTFTALMGLLFALGTLVVWYMGGRDVLFGAMTLGSLMAFLMYLAMFYTPLTTIAESTAWFANFVGISRRIGDLLETPSELEIARPGGAAHEAGAHAGGRGQVEFQDVSFGYDKTRPVLKHVSFTIAPGEMVGVVGRSGSGKSTLVSLIGRLYEADAGQILIDGRDARQIDPRELRRQIGMVPQRSLSLSRIGRREHRLRQLAGRGGTNPRRRQAGRCP